MNNKILTISSILLALGAFSLLVNGAFALVDLNPSNGQNKTTPTILILPHVNKTYTPTPTQQQSHTTISEVKESTSSHLPTSEPEIITSDSNSVSDTNDKLQTLYDSNDDDKGEAILDNSDNQGPVSEINDKLQNLFDNNDNNNHNDNNNEDHKIKITNHKQHEWTQKDFNKKYGNSLPDDGKKDSDD